MIRIFLTVALNTRETERPCCRMQSIKETVDHESSSYDAIAKTISKVIETMRHLFIMWSQDERIYLIHMPKCLFIVALVVAVLSAVCKECQK